MSPSPNRDGSDSVVHRPASDLDSNSASASSSPLPSVAALPQATGPNNVTQRAQPPRATWGRYGLLAAQLLPLLGASAAVLRVRSSAEERVREAQREAQRASQPGEQKTTAALPQVPDAEDARHALQVRRGVQAWEFGEIDRPWHALMDNDSP